MNETKELLRAELKTQFEVLEQTAVDKEEYRTVVDCAAKLIDRELEIEKFEAEKKEQEKQAKRDMIHKIIGYSLTTAGIVVPVVTYSIWAKASLIFEEKGTITSLAGKNAFSKLLSIIKF